MKRSIIPLMGFCLCAAGCSAGGPQVTVGYVGAGGSRGELPGETGGAGAVLGGDASASTALSTHIEQNDITVTFVTLTCSEKCADVVAVAKGGFERYTFRWEDGSTDPNRHVCPTSSTSYEVSVTDAGITSGEFKRDPVTVTVPLAANVLSCSHPSSDGGSPSDAGACSPVPGATPAETLAIDPTGAVRYFANGATLPAGKYRIEYVDGCMQFALDLGYPPWGWTIHTGTLPGNPALSGSPYSGDCVLVGATPTDVVGILPGTTIPPPSTTTYADCVTANKAADTPLDFDFKGGKLGLFVEDLLAGDNTGGETSGGVSPTWKLRALSVCQ